MYVFKYHESEKAEKNHTPKSKTNKQPLPQKSYKMTFRPENAEDI